MCSCAPGLRHAALLLCRQRPPPQPQPIHVPPRCSRAEQPAEEAGHRLLALTAGAGPLLQPPRRDARSPHGAGTLQQHWPALAQPGGLQHKPRRSSCHRELHGQQHLHPAPAAALQLRAGGGCRGLRRDAAYEPHPSTPEPETERHRGRGRGSARRVPPPQRHPQGAVSGRQQRGHRGGQAGGRQMQRVRQRCHAQREGRRAAGARHTRGEEEEGALGSRLGPSFSGDPPLPGTWELPSA
mmetsp:Transcript_15794/g.34944  ORF Transcript_15794/g.34944 Transcript_15794/m.34944 type:complete len:240 (-) Transcript_15794:435-1154(-)